MSILVDAYNVLHVTGVLPPDLAGVDVRGLARLIADSRWRGRRATLVCDGTGSADGTPEGRVESNVEVRYAGPGRDADSVIEQIIEVHTAPRRLLVVSSDRRLQRAARRRRAFWMSSDGFLERLARDARKAGSRPGRGKQPATPLSPERVDSWLEHFGVHEDDPLMRLKRAAGQAESASPGSERSEARRQPGENAAPQDDPLLREAMQEWRDRISWDDLDMRRWLDEGHSPGPGGSPSQ